MFPLDARVYRRTAVRRRDLMVCGCVREGRPSEAKARYGGIPNGTIGRGCGKNSAHPGKSTTGAEAHTDSLSLTWPCAGRFSTGSEAVPFPVGCTSRALQWCRLKVRGRDGHAIAGRMAALRAGRSPSDRRGRLSPHNLYHFTASLLCGHCNVPTETLAPGAGAVVGHGEGQEEEEEE